MPKDDQSFFITLSFDKDIRKPQRILSIASAYINALGECDRTLLKNFHSEINTVLVLDGLEFGSLKVWLQQVLENIDEALYDIDPKKLIGKFLIKGKYLLLKALTDKNRLPSKEELTKTSNEIQDLVKETNVLAMPAYKRIPESEIARSLQVIAAASSRLQNGETISFSSSDGNVQLEPGVAITDKEITELLTARTIQNEAEVILKVRKPDFLGETGWGFHHNNRNFSAVINDKDWLKQFHSGELDIRPGDALRVKLQETTMYDAAGNVVHEDHKITHVIEIIHQKDVQQGLLLDTSKKTDEH